MRKQEETTLFTYKTWVSHWHIALTSPPSLRDVISRQDGDDKDLKFESWSCLSLWQGHLLQPPYLVLCWAGYSFLKQRGKGWKEACDVSPYDLFEQSKVQLSPFKLSNEAIQNLYYENSENINLNSQIHTRRKGINYSFWLK